MGRCFGASLKDKEIGIELAKEAKEGWRPSQNPCFQGTTNCGVYSWTVSRAIMTVNAVRNSFNSKWKSGNNQSTAR